LTDPLLPGRSVPVSSWTLDILTTLGALLGVCVLRGGCRLVPRPVVWFGGGDEIRIAGCALDALLPTAGVSISCAGIAGTGGASRALGRATPRFGDGSRNVLSDIEPELSRRSSCGLGRPVTDPATELAREEVEALLRRVRFVWTSATLVGVVGRERSAVAAAAAERFALDLFWARKACAAAVVAEGSTTVDALMLEC